MKSVSDVAAIPDAMERMTEAAALAREAEARAEVLRTKRDNAVLVLLRPFSDAVAPTNAQRARLRAELDSGEITAEEYEAGLTRNRDQRRADLDEPKVALYPVDVYKMLGATRSMINRILMRMPDGPLAPMRDPGGVARDAHNRLPEVEATIRDAREIRDTAALMLMGGTDENGAEVPTVSNADISRATGLTTARIAQLRESAQ